MTEEKASNCKPQVWKNVNATIRPGREKMSIYVGVDVSKSLLDVYVDNSYFQYSNTNEGIKKFIKELNRGLGEGQTIKLIVCEASGGYERPMIKLLAENKLPTHVAHANHVRSFAKAKGLLAKTDKIDAKLIRDYAKVLEIQPDSFQLSEVAEEIRELMKRREQLQQDKIREMNRLDKCHGKNKHSIESHIKWLTDAIKGIDDKLKTLSNHAAVKMTYGLLMSLPSIGLIIASALIGYLPELGRLCCKKLSALVGVAPYNHDSGRHTGKRFIQGGRKALRSYLYMAALSSLRWNKDLKIFYDRLVAKGKPAKVALTAVMRKMLSMIASVMARQTPWQENFCKNL